MFVFVLGWMSDNNVKNFSKLFKILLYLLYLYHRVKPINKNLIVMIISTNIDQIITNFNRFQILYLFTLINTRNTCIRVNFKISWVIMWSSFDMDFWSWFSKISLKSWLYLVCKLFLVNGLLVKLKQMDNFSRLHGFLIFN